MGVKGTTYLFTVLAAAHTTPTMTSRVAAPAKISGQKLRCFLHSTQISLNSKKKMPYSTAAINSPMTTKKTIIYAP